MKSSQRAGERKAVSLESGLIAALSLLAWPWHRVRGIRRRFGRRQRGVIKNSVMAYLTHIDHYEDSATGRHVTAETPHARSVGWSYRQIKERVEAEYPGSRVSMMTIRSYARDAKQEGLAMPRSRPYSKRVGNGGAKH